MDFFKQISVVKDLLTSGLCSVGQYLGSDERFYMPALKTVDWEAIGLRLFLFIPLYLDMLLNLVVICIIIILK